MKFYDQVILPRLIDCACGARPIERQREKLVPLAQGDVLEVGIGSGRNIPFYDRDRLRHFYGLEPCARSRAMASERALRWQLPLQWLGLDGTAIPLPDAVVDTVVVTYALCTIPDPVVALREMARVLRPDGELLFCEHGWAPDVEVQLWQQRLNPIWRRVAGGCHLNRPILDMLAAGGFRVRNAETMYLPGVLRAAGWNVWGSAVPAAR